jgi:hypothetical protein
LPATHMRAHTHEAQSDATHSTSVYETLNPKL